MDTGPNDPDPPESDWADFMRRHRARSVRDRLCRPSQLLALQERAWAGNLANDALHRAPRLSAREQVEAIRRRITRPREP